MNLQNFHHIHLNAGDIIGPINLQYQFGFTSLSQAVNTLLSAAFFFAAIAALFYLFLGAFKYILAGSDEAKLKNARSTMVHAIVGLILMGLVMVFFQVIVSAIPGLDQYFNF